MTRLQAVAIVVAAVWVLAGAASGAEAPAGLGGVPVPVTLEKGSALWLTGTSTLHDYESRTAEPVLTITREATAPAPDNGAALAALLRESQVHGVELSVPVKSLHSHKDGLDKNLWKTLRADEFPSIRFRMTNYTVDAKSSGDTLQIQAVGRLTVSGVERPDTLVARAWPSGNTLRLEGHEPLRMSTFGIKPPTMMLGTLRVDDRITVHFQFTLTPRGDTVDAPASGASR